jgi:hypothetical protein
MLWRLLLLLLLVLLFWLLRSLGLLPLLPGGNVIQGNVCNSHRLLLGCHRLRLHFGGRQ